MNSTEGLVLLPPTVPQGPAPSGASGSQAERPAPWRFTPSAVQTGPFPPQKAPGACRPDRWRACPELRRERSDRDVQTIPPARRLPPAGREHGPTWPLRTLNKNKPPRVPEGRKSNSPTAPKAIFFGAVRTGDSAISNRNTNESRNAATLPKPTTSHFLFATKLHFSEEKAKRE